MLLDIDVSFIVPVHDNAKTLAPLCALIRKAFADRKIEIILVDDASSDASLEIARTLEVTVVEHHARFGQSLALLSGLAAASGRASVCLDADLQDQPRDCRRLVDALPRDGVAFAQRAASTAGSRAFKGLLRVLYPSLPARVGLCFAIDRSVGERLLALKSPGYVLAMLGALRLPTTVVAVERKPRLGGGSAYSRARRVRHGVKMLTAALLLRLRARSGA